ncbi:MAG TPA: 2-oxoacid:acceptor oxidoreductase subunit alpha [Sneathiellales bacterium]|nr:2-oxoacid:acceptor oxidoreductase subunit alpha [Sneathiellales bacterium]
MAENNREEVDSVVVRFAGDSGDGIQLTGGRFTETTAISGQDLETFPDFPAEIRAPVGTTFGVSAFQINFGSRQILTAGDAPDVLVALNPAALKVNISDIEPGGLIIVNTSAFKPANLRKAGYEVSPFEDGSLDNYRVFDIAISDLTIKAVEDLELSNKDALRCKNMWALGLVLWLFGRKRGPVLDWLHVKFAKKPIVVEANIAALNAGHIYGETSELPINIVPYQVDKAKILPGLYRSVVGSQAMAYGLVAGARAANLDIMLGSYPITPASSLMHALASLKEYGVVTFQAEDEIAAIGSAIGASFAGSLGVTSSSGPGISLKSEALGLAVAVELPLIVVNWQRGGPSTGLPTKTEQSDLLQAMYGRHGDCPLPVIAARTPADCFETAIEAIRLATKYMTPVILLADGYLANASQPWRIPDAETLPNFPVEFETETEGFHPFKRDPDTLARVWAIPGTEGLSHRIGGVEKGYDTGNISYDTANHQLMTDVRGQKIAGIANDIPLQVVEGGHEAKGLAVVGWGSTFGALESAVDRAREDGGDACHIHIRHLSPFPKNLGELLSKFDHILVPELNTGQLSVLLRDQFLLPAESVNKVAGQPFKASEIEEAIWARLET